MPDFRAGFVAFVGRPNVGKSTLMNALVGKEITPASSKPQTTRHAVRGIVHHPEFQLVIVDTPGLHKPRTLLGKRLNAVSKDTWPDVDVVAMLFPVDESIGAGDLFILRELARIAPRHVIAVVTKTDLVSREVVAEKLLAVTTLGEDTVGVDFSEIVPVSAVQGEQIHLLAEVIARYVPSSPALYPDGTVTDEPEERTIAETIRAIAAEGMDNELPHSLAVVVDEMDRSDTSMAIVARIFVERDSQKPIVLGSRGSRIRQIRIRAQRRLRGLLGVPVQLQLHVAVAKEWQGDPKHLARLGY